MLRETTKTFSHDTRNPGRERNWIPAECQSVTLTQYYADWCFGRSRENPRVSNDITETSNIDYIIVTWVKIGWSGDP